MEAQSLVEPGLKVHVRGMLQKCRAYKDGLISVGVNVMLLVAFVAVCWATLSYKARNRIPKKSEHENECAKRDFVLQAIGQGRPPITKMGPISGMPGFTSDVRFSST